MLPLRRVSVNLSFVFLALSLSSRAANAESGYDLWLRYEPLAGEVVATNRDAISGVYVETANEGPEPAGLTPTQEVIASELDLALGKLLGKVFPAASALDRDRLLIVISDAGSPVLAELGWRAEVDTLGTEGFLIRSARLDEDRTATVIASAGKKGALYGTFRLLRHLAQGMPVDDLDIAERPKYGRRLLNHWDNLDGTIERGYAGTSLWNWNELPGKVDPRLVDYARANASIGVNGTVLNNVNAAPRILESAYLSKVAAIADTLRPYGVRVYLSVNFASPIVIGGLPTADPLDPKVAAWWRDKVSEIYRLVPDFGGFLVKANSEGQPGPQDFGLEDGGRSHADGANVLADALEPHGGVVFWRAFVYDADVDPDRIKRSYLEMVPLDGSFRDNVFVQAKNGPLDFQPREPFHPLFGALEQTPLAAELQVTQEYLGQSTHLVYLAPMWTEFLGADTYAGGPAAGSSSLVRDEFAAIAGVANTGSDPNWTGHPFAQANWYAYGRLAWDPTLSPEQIADEWIRQTWSRDPKVIQIVRELMMDTRETYVRYTMPLGLHHLIGGDHYAPMPENPDPRRADWSAIYYHHADLEGIGVDRTARGTGALLQYTEPLQSLWGDPATCPKELLLWFHRLPWDHEMAPGRTLWQELVATYRRGAQEAALFPERWKQVEGRVDPERFEKVLGLLETQASEAGAWSEHCVSYFRSRMESDRGPDTASDEGEDDDGRASGRRGQPRRPPGR